MIRRDMPEVLDIEQQSLEFPWSEEDFVRCLRQRNHIGIVAESDDRVIGYLIYDRNRKDRIGIIKCAVHPRARRSGAGSKLVGYLTDKLSHQRSATIVVDVSERRVPAQLFFRACGFRAVEVVPEFFGFGEDSCRMEYRYAG
jgi:ribosomal-protein-alanine N-acetyltransferase